MRAAFFLVDSLIGWVDLTLFGVVIISYGRLYVNVINVANC